MIMRNEILSKSLIFFCKTARSIGVSVRARKEGFYRKRGFLVDDCEVLFRRNCFPNNSLQLKILPLLQYTYVNWLIAILIQSSFYDIHYMYMTEILIRGYKFFIPQVLFHMTMYSYVRDLI